MSTDNNKPKRRLTFYHFLLWLLVGIQFSAHVLNHITPEADRTGVSLVNAWIGIGTCFSDNWSAFTIITLLGCIGVYLYKHLMNEKFTLQDALPYLVAVLANVFFFLKAWDVNAWTEKWGAVNKAPISFMIWTLITVGITVAVHAFIKSRQAYAEFDKQVLPSLDELGEGDKLRERSQAEIEYMTKHPRMYRHKMKQILKSQKKNIESEISLQRYNFRKQQNEDVIRIKSEQMAEAIKENNKEAISKIIDEVDEDFKNLDVDDTSRLSIKKVLKSDAKKWIAVLSVIITVILVIVIICLIPNTKPDDISGLFSTFQDGLDSIATELPNIEQPLRSILTYIGAPILLIIVSAILLITLNFFIRLLLTILFDVTNPVDESKVYRFVTLIKLLFFDTFDAVLRPLLFLPDFLEVVEDLLLGTNLDDKANKYNKEDELDDK